MVTGWRCAGPVAGEDEGGGGVCARSSFGDWCRGGGETKGLKTLWKKLLMVENVIESRSFGEV